jgi:streptogrisin D
MCNSHYGKELTMEKDLVLVSGHLGAAPRLSIRGTGSTGSVSRRMAAAIAVTGLLMGALVAPSSAQAAPAAPDDVSDVHVAAGISGRNARALADDLGASRTGGVYLNGSRRMVVAVTDEDAASVVRQAGGEAELVKYSTTTLKSVQAELDSVGDIPGTSWGVDPSTNQVSVELDSTVDAANTAKLKAVTDRFGDAVRVERIQGKIEEDTVSTGGEMMSANIDGYQSPYCSLGFNVTNSSGDRYIVTAGHCTNAHGTWYQSWSGELLGNNVQSSFPGNDYGIIKYNHSSVVAYGTVHHNTQQISSVSLAYDTEPVSRAGGVSNDMIGEVLVYDTKVTYDDGKTVNHVIKTTNCSRRGDSGGPLFDGTLAIGILSGGNGGDQPCSDHDPIDERSFYQPLEPVLDLYNLNVY